jgi:hypothetical protein
MDRNSNEEAAPGPSLGLLFPTSGSPASIGGLVFAYAWGGKAPRIRQAKNRNSNRRRVGLCDAFMASPLSLTGSGTCTA